MDTVKGICELQYEYARTADLRLHDDLEALFTESATWTRISKSGRQHFVGRVEIRAGLEQMLGELGTADPRPGMHIMTNPVLKVSENSASGTWNFMTLSLLGPPGSSPIRTCGTYEMSYAHQGGRWMIDKLLCNALWTAS
jgi:hypothetical protein